MSSKNRVSYTADAIMMMRSNDYAKVQLPEIEKIMSEALSKISDEELNLLDRKGDKATGDKGQLFGVSINVQPDKYEAPVKDKDGKETGETVMKDVLRYRVWVNFGYPQGICLSFNPSPSHGSLSMGSMSLLSKGADGKFVQTEEGKVLAYKGIQEIKSVIEGQDTSNPIIKAFHNVVFALGELESVEKKLSRSNTDFKPYYIGQKTAAVLNGENPYMPPEVVEWHRNTVDKMMVLATQIAEATPELKSEKEKDDYTYMVDARPKLSIEPRVQYLKDANGNAVVNAATGKKQTTVVKDENGNIIYDAKMSLSSAGSDKVNVDFQVDVTDEQAKIKWFEAYKFRGNIRENVAKGFAELNKCPEDIKAYIKAISDANLFVPFERKANSKMWDLAMGIKDVFVKEAPDHLDANGKKVFNENGTPKKEYYAIYDKFTSNGKDNEVVEIGNLTDKSAKIEIRAREDESLYAIFKLIGTQGEKSPRVHLNAKNIDQMIDNDVVKKVLKKNIPELADGNRQAQAER